MVCTPVVLMPLLHENQQNKHRTPLRGALCTRYVTYTVVTIVISGAAMLNYGTQFCLLGLEGDENFQDFVFLYLFGCCTLYKWWYFLGGFLEP